jgi:hypothetical protein
LLAEIFPLAIARQINILGERQRISTISNTIDHFLLHSSLSNRVRARIGTRIFFSVNSDKADPSRSIPKILKVFAIMQEAM